MERSDRAIRPVTRRTAVAALGGAIAFPNVVLAQQRTQIVAAGLPEDSATPVLYAIDRGIFRRYNLDVRLEAQRSGPAVASGVAGGSYQIGKASINPLAIAHSRRIPFVCVAAGGLSTATNPIAGLMVRVDSPYRTAADLNGKTVAVGALNDIFTLALKSWMDRNGGDSTSLKLVEIPISAIGEAIETNRVAAGSANEPILGGALASGKLKVLAHTFDAISRRFMFTAWFTTQTWATANRGAVENFNKAVREGAVLANTHRDDSARVIAKFTGIPVRDVRRQGRTEGGTSLDPRLIQPVIDAAAHYKDIPAAFDARELILSGLS